MKDKAIEIINSMKKYDNIYIIGHNNVDCDSYFSSYLLSQVLKSFNINVHFCILDDYSILEEDRRQIEDFKIEEPMVLKRDDILNKIFILVDHNDPSQSLKSDKCNIVLSIDHHIETGIVKNCYSIEYTSTGLFIYDLFKDVYNFSQALRDIVALTVMSDSCFLTTSRFKDSDKVVYNELNTTLDPTVIRKKYFKTTDFNLDPDFNIKNNHKVYHVDGLEINRVILKGNESDKKYISDYVNRSNEIYNNNLLIWNDFDNLITYVYYNGKLLKQYDYIVTSSMLITKDLINEIKTYKRIMK